MPGFCGLKPEAEVWFWDRRPWIHREFCCKLKFDDR